jgi:hypothetical protein
VPASVRGTAALKQRGASGDLLDANETRSPRQHPQTTEPTHIPVRRGFLLVELRGLEPLH